MPTNLYNDISINDRKFTVKKFNAMDGLKIGRLLIAKAAPLIPLLEKTLGTGNSAPEDAKVYEAVGSVLETLSDQDVEDLVSKCLRVCYERLPGGLAPVIDETGNYGVEDVEFDMGLTIRLCVEAIKWGAADFFGENRLNLKSIARPVG